MANKNQISSEIYECAKGGKAKAKPIHSFIQQAFIHAAFHVRQPQPCSSLSHTWLSGSWPPFSPRVRALEECFHNISLSFRLIFEFCIRIVCAAAGKKAPIFQMFCCYSFCFPFWPTERATRSKLCYYLRSSFCMIAVWVRLFCDVTAAFSPLSA